MSTPGSCVPPRSGAARVAGVVLCAGRSSRTYPLNKLLAPVRGAPLAAHVVDAALQAPLCEVIVVTGHDASALRAALGGRPLRYAHNPDFGSGLSSSLQVGLQTISADVDGALICLADMPRIRREHLVALLDAFELSGRSAVCLPVFGGQRGNPVLWPRDAFEQLRAVRGDAGGRVLLAEFAPRVRHVTMTDDAILTDIDTLEALVVHNASCTTRSSGSSDGPPATDADGNRPRS